MVIALEPLKKGNEQYGHRGRFSVQLEVPPDSTLRQADIDRVLRIASWDDDINEQVDGYEGGRSVLITKAATSYSNGTALNGLQISGVGYTAMQPHKGTVYFEQGRHSFPPTLEDFSVRPEASIVTSSVKDGEFVFDRTGYKPLGSYTERQWKSKIVNTQMASGLTASFSVPAVEAYGRYLDLAHEGGNLGFIVFSIPDVKLDRFLAEVLRKYDVDLRPHMAEFASVLGKSVRELHDAGHVHRQLHFSNYYYLEGQRKLHLMDWGTVIPLDGSEHEMAMKRVIDIELPWQCYEDFIMSYFHAAPAASKGKALASFLNSFLGSYFSANNIDTAGLYDKYGKAVVSKELVSLVEGRVRNWDEVTHAEKELASRVYNVKGSQRNLPCPCGSGVKYKKCHG